MWPLKAYALFHDPPHKALWFEHEDYRIYDKNSHEEEGAKLMYRVFEGLGLGGTLSEKERRAVAEADRLAASFDRWALPPTPGGYWAKAKYLINPFNYDKKAEVKKPEAQEFRRGFQRFVEALRGAAERGRGDEKRLYVYAYAAYELAWIKAGLPALPADTRAPTHTVFDHLYATASVLNWVLGARGCLAVADIPGIQSVLKSARKAGDYRAGSMLVSLAAWGVAWRFMQRHGPDVLLSPTPRFNPLFYAQLRRENPALWTLYAEVVGQLAGRQLGLAEAAAKFVEDILLRNSAIFPGTAYFALPECKEDEAEAYFEQSLSDLLEAAKGAEVDSLPIRLYPLGEDVRKIVSKALDGVKPDYLPFRWAYVAVDEARDGLEKWAKEVYGYAGDPERFLFARMMYLLNERKALRTPKTPAWFEKDGA
ncbi:MAG: type III-B CRISPR-associated protein Cas10/Cmr2, partial [Thermoproteus sp.]